MIASSSARAWALTASSIPLLLLFSNRVDAAAVPKDELVEDRADTPLFMFLWLLLLVHDRIELQDIEEVCGIVQCRQSSSGRVRVCKRQSVESGEL